jgi:hypothetical protein
LEFGLGTHYVELFVGNPPQRVSLIVDTGSSLTAFTCTECHMCGKHSDPPFDSKRSKTCEKIPCTSTCSGITSGHCDQGTCRLSKRYTEGSRWTAVALEDQFWSTDPSTLQNGPAAGGTFTDKQMASNTLRFVFGCQFSATGTFSSIFTLEMSYANVVYGLPCTLPRKVCSSSRLRTA